MDIKELITILKEGESTTIEFKESVNKDLNRSVCALSNTKGGKILVGVDDNGNPVGTKSDKVEQEISAQVQALRPMPQVEIEKMPIANANIVIINVKESNTLVSCGNVVYIRVGTNNYPLSIDEVIEKSAESLRIFFDQITTEISASELNKGLLKQYLEIRQKIRGVDRDPDITDVAVKLKILKKKSSGLFLTNAGILCFTEDPQKYIGNSTVRLTKFNDNEMKTYSLQNEFTGSLQKIVLEIESFFVKNLNRVGGLTVGFKRQEYLEYPLNALREAIINAIIHRNYFDAAEIRIFIFPDRIEIKNPGSFPPGVSVENPEHKPRNPQIAQFFYDLGLTEKYGSGIKKIIKETSEHPLAGVRFEIKPYSTTVVFYKTLSGVDLDATNLKILETLTSGSKGSGSIAKAIGLSRQSTVERLRNLNALGFIRQQGEGPKTTYVLAKLFQK